MEMDERDFLAALEELLGEDMHPLSALANTAALIWESVTQINWAGFYLLDDGALWLGPFQGKVACTRIEPGKGVCGTAFVNNETIVVPDVHAFPGHIACDALSRSEIVVPLRRQGRPVGVLDVDSPVPDRFTRRDRDLLEAVAALLETRCLHRPFAYAPGERARAEKEIQ